MKKLLVALFAIVAIIGSLLVIKSRVGDLRPMLLPVMKKTITPTPVSKGNPLDFALTVKSGFQVGSFATNLGDVRVLAFSPAGTLIASVPDQGKIIMLPDRNHDGIADEVDTIIAGLQNPHGIAFYKNYLYVAEETQMTRYTWNDQQLIGGVARFDKKLFDMPQGGRHTTRVIAFDKNGKMYVTIGSTCDVCYEPNPFLATVIVSDWNGAAPKLFAKGLRNAPFITFNPKTDELWGTEMGRDYLGDITPPDEINIIRYGKNYGWPICYGNKIHDTQFDHNQYFRDPCADTIPPIYKIEAHSAPLGLVFINSKQFPDDWQNDLLVAYHGSWNRSTPSGYKVVHMKVTGNTITGEDDFLTGFLQDGGAVARPVDLAFDNDGNLYISDDKGGNVFIISKK